MLVLELSGKLLERRTWAAEASADCGSECQHSFVAVNDVRFEVAEVRHVARSFADTAPCFGQNVGVETVFADLADLRFLGATW